MTPDHDQDCVNPENLSSASAPAPTTKVFSEAEAQAALARLKAKAAAQRTADGTPQPPAPCEAVEMPDDEAAVMELEEVHEKLADMKSVWDKLRAEGVPIEERPLTDLPWSVQFQAQAEADPTGKDMAWWKAHRADFADLE